MPSNRKLSAVVRGRIVTDIARREEAALIRFNDGSLMTVRLGTALPLSTVLGRVVKVRQDGRRLQLDLEGGHTLELTTAEPTASVLLRSRDGTLEYAD